MVFDTGIPDLAVFGRFFVFALVLIQWCTLCSGVLSEGGVEKAVFSAFPSQHYADVSPEHSWALSSFILYSIWYVIDLLIKFYI